MNSKSMDSKRKQMKEIQLQKIEVTVKNPTAQKEKKSILEESIDNNNGFHELGYLTAKFDKQSKLNLLNEMAKNKVKEDIPVKPFQNMTYMYNIIARTDLKTQNTPTSNSQLMSKSYTMSGMKAETNLVMSSTYLNSPTVQSVSNPTMAFKPQTSSSDQTVPLYSTALSSGSRLKSLVSEVCGKTDSEGLEVIGDNFDIFIRPTQMTKDRQNKSHHWFLNLVTEKRVEMGEFCATESQQDLMDMDNCEFLLSNDEMKVMKSELTHHVSHILCDYFEFLKPVKGDLNPYIHHRHLDEMRKKSNYTVLGLLSESENESVVPRKYVSKDDKEVIEPITFGGDVLTNERAYSAQTAVRNGQTSYEKLMGLVHRPEGLHILMNALGVMTTFLSLHVTTCEYQHAYIVGMVILTISCTLFAHMSRPILLLLFL